MPRRTLAPLRRNPWASFHIFRLCVSAGKQAILSRFKALWLMPSSIYPSWLRAWLESPYNKPSTCANVRRTYIPSCQPRAIHSVHRAFRRTEIANTVHSPQYRRRIRIPSHTPAAIRPRIWLYTHEGIFFEPDNTVDVVLKRQTLK